MLVCRPLATVCLLLIATARATTYCLPGQSCWPTDQEWADLNTTVGGRLFATGTIAEAESLNCQCLATGNDGTAAADAAHGVCMAHTSCMYDHCVPNNLNTPAYSLEVGTVADIQAAVNFARQKSIPVSIKTSGHNYASSSMMHGSLLIWMYRAPKHATIGAHTDTCGTSHPAAIKAGGGQPWGEIYDAVHSNGNYDILGGGSVNVGCCGGWLAGGGLTTMSRLRGLGIDNVLGYEVVLADGSYATADACTNADLFWALRGGGGGAWGVVTALWYRLYPKTAAVRFHVYVDYANGTGRSNLDGNLDSPTLTAFYKDHFIPYLVNVLQPASMDGRWGGYWAPNCRANGAAGTCLDMFFYGPQADALSTVIDPFHAWVRALPNSVFGQPATEVLFSNHNNDALAISTPRTLPSYLGELARSSSAGVCASSTPPQACTRFNGLAQDWDGNRPDYARPASWLLPVAFWQDTAKAIRVLGMVAEPHSDLTGGYWLGGAINNVHVDNTSIAYAMRTSVANIMGPMAASMATIRREIPDSAPCYNHDGYPLDLGSTPAAWQDGYWGAQLTRLNSVKARYDPTSVFNSFQGIGYTETAGAIPHTLSTACAGSGSDVNVGAIVGGVVGGCFVPLLMLGLWLGGVFTKWGCPSPCAKKAPTTKAAAGDTAMQAIPAPEGTNIEKA